MNAENVNIDPHGAKRESYQELEEHNGWTNRPTWLVALHFDNEQATQEYWLKAAERALRNAEPPEGIDRTPETQAAYDLADEMEETISDRLHSSAPMANDLLRFTLAVVNWEEVAAHYIEEAIERETA